MFHPNIPALSFLMLAAAAAAGWSQPPAGAADPAKAPDAHPKEAKTEKKMETITLASGCFWCGEAILQRIKGIESAKPGYTAGKTKNPTYEQVCTGQTGHAEAVQVVYDPAVITTEKLIELFFEMHDPTTLNRQGADAGTQYRSGIYYHTDEQRKVAEEVKKRVDASGRYKDKIVTEIQKFDTFYPAEAYHEAYYNKNPNQGYCRAVIAPKLKKLGLETK